MGYVIVNNWNQQVWVTSDVLGYCQYPYMDDGSVALTGFPFPLINSISSSSHHQQTLSAWTTYECRDHHLDHWRHKHKSLIEMIKYICIHLRSAQHHRHHHPLNLLPCFGGLADEQQSPSLRGKLTTNSIIYTIPYTHHKLVKVTSWLCMHGWFVNDNITLWFRQKLYTRVKCARTTAFGMRDWKPDRLQRSCNTRLLWNAEFTRKSGTGKCDRIKKMIW